MSTSRVLGLMIASAWLVAGCNGAKKIDVGGTCILNSDCGGSLVCTWGICHVACHASADCPKGQSCIIASAQSTVCQGPTPCTYNSDCQAGLICAVDRQCRQQCQKNVDCTNGQTCTTTNTCAEQSQVDSNKNLLVPDGGLSATGGTMGTGGTGGSTSPNPDASPDLPADVPVSTGGTGGSAGGAYGVGGTSGTGGASGTGTGSSISPNSDASPDIPADVPGGSGGVSSTGGILSTAGVASIVDARGTGGTTSIGGTTNTGGAAGAGGTTSPPDAGADRNSGTPDATPTPSRTVALFHFDGTQGSTVLTDSSGTGKVATITGNPVISTAQSKFGGASLYIDGTSSVRTNYVVSSGGSDFVMDGDFTLDFWIFPISYPDTWGTLVLLGDCDQNQPNGPSWNSGGAKWHFNPYYYSGAIIDAPAPLTWHHVAVTRSGLTYRAFVDGATVYTNTSSTFSFTDGTLWITGCGSGGDNGDLNGYIDELRVVKGVAVWTSDFAPPTAPYTAANLLPPDGGTLDTPAVLDVAGGDASLGDAVPQEQKLMLWLNSTTITGLADGANVATWADGSGNGRNVSAAGVPPTYRVNQMNGLPIVRFDGSSDSLATAGNFGLSGDPSFTVTLVAKISSSNSPSTSPWMWAFGDLWHALTGACLQWISGTVEFGTGNWNQAYPPADSFATYADAPAIVTVRRTPGEIGQTTEFFFDGTRQTVTGATATPTMTDGLFLVGSWSGARSIMDVAELLAYGIALTDGDRAALECSLGAKYNIAVAGCK